MRCFMKRQSGLQTGDDYSQNYDGHTECLAAGYFLAQDQDTHDEDPDKTGRRDTRHY